MEDNEAPRDLTNDQTSKLQTLLHKVLNNDQSEDASDILDYSLAMVSNGKSVKYIADELKSMEMDICAGSVADEMGTVIGSFLRNMPSEALTSTAAEPKEEESNENQESLDSGSKMKSLKATRGENALTMSGALGTKKKPKKDNPKVKPRHNALMASGALGSSREGNGGNKSKLQSQSKNNRPNPKKGGGGNGRSIASEAFKRLAQQRDHERPSPRGRGGGRGGRGGRGGERRHDNRVGGRDGRGDGRGHQDRHGGRKRQGDWDERNGRDPGPGRNGAGRMRGGRGHDNDGKQSDFNSRDRNAGRMSTGRDDFRNKGGRGSEFGRGPSSWNENKRARVIEQQGEHFNNQMQWQDNASDLNKGPQNYSYVRNASRGGRGSGSEINSTTPMVPSGTKIAPKPSTNQATQEAAAASPSPLIASEFGTAKLSYGGRGYGGFGGRGFRGRGRGGRGFPGRGNVVAMLAAKTWTRSKPTTGEDSSGT